MIQKLKQIKKIESVVVLLAATEVAGALWLVGLEEVVWAPYFFAAVYLPRSRSCLTRLWKGARA